MSHNSVVKEQIRKIRQKLSDATGRNDCFMSPELRETESRNT